MIRSSIGTGWSSQARTARLAALLVGVILLPLLAGCRIDMHDQPKYETFESSELFANSSSARHPPEGTVPRSEWGTDSVMETGYDLSGELVAVAPIEIDERILKRGEQRYGMFCTPCHGALGDGLGMIVRRGFKQPPSMHEDRLRNETDGYFFDVMTRGFGQMPSYAPQIKVEDRWAIITYIRALQYSQAVQADGAIAELIDEEIAKAARADDVDDHEASGENEADHSAEASDHSTNPSADASTKLSSSRGS